MGYTPLLINGTYLVVLVQPEERQICNADWFPMVRYLFASAVNDMCDFICYNEFQVLHPHITFPLFKKQTIVFDMRFIYILKSVNTYLRRQLITDEQSILDFDSTDHVLVVSARLLLKRLLVLHRRYEYINNYYNNCCFHIIKVLSIKWIIVSAE